MQLRTGSRAFSGFCSLPVLELDPWWRIGSGYSQILGSHGISKAP